VRIGHATVLVAALLLLGVLSLWGQVSEEALWNDPSLVRVEPSELAFTDKEYEYATSQSVYLMARFNEGWVMMLSLFEYRSVLIHKWGIYTTVTSPAGREHWATLDMRDEAVRFDTTRLYVTDGTNTVEGGLSSYRVTFDFRGFACDLRLDNILPAWKGGDGLDVMSRDGRAFAARVMGCPWGRVTGWIKMDGRTVEVEGQGLLEKALTVNPMNRLDPYLYSIRVFADDSAPPEDRWYIGVLDVTTHEAYGGARQSRMEVGRAGEWLFTTHDYTLEPREVRQGIGVPYPVPRRVGITARAPGYLLQAEYRAEVLFNVTDVLSEVPKWIRPIAAVFVKRPVYFRFLGKLDGTLQFPDGHTEPVHLSGPYEYVVTR
jgi:hypothetical protein